MLPLLFGTLFHFYFISALTIYWWMGGAQRYPSTLAPMMGIAGVAKRVHPSYFSCSQIT
jgi:hypothetical protein